MSKTILPKNVTMLCIDTANHALAREAIIYSMNQCHIDNAALISDRNLMVDGVEFFQIEPIASMGEYNSIMMKRLLDFIKTDYVLTIQFDGFIINPFAWSDEFLGYDYVGAPWNTRPPTVGNGGFSLRSRRLLTALQDPEIVPGDDPEDVSICRAFRGYLESKHQIKFAPPELAERFSIEKRISKDPLASFGFHGLGNLIYLYRTPQQLRFLIDNISDYTLKSMSCIVMLLMLLQADKKDAAHRLLLRILHHCTLRDIKKHCDAAGFSAQAIFDLIALPHEPASN